MNETKIQFLASFYDFIWYSMTGFYITFIKWIGSLFVWPFVIYTVQFYILGPSQIMNVVFVQYLQKQKKRLSTGRCGWSKSDFPDLVEEGSNGTSGTEDVWLNLFFTKRFCRWLSLLRSHWARHWKSGKSVRGWFPESCEALKERAWNERVGIEGERVVMGKHGIRWCKNLEN